MSATLTQRPITLDRLERRTRAIGHELFDRIGQGPGILERAWWDDRLMKLTLNDPIVRVQLFRFIDVMPALRSSEDVRRHLHEYLDEAQGHVAWWLRLAIVATPPSSPGVGVLAAVARFAAGHMAKRFIAGETPDQAFATVLKLRTEGVAFTADLLGEAVISSHEADVYQTTCLNLVRGLAQRLNAEPEITRIDRDDHGPLPRVNLSLKLSSLSPRFDPIHPESTTDQVAARLRPILRLAQSVLAYVHIDMEQRAYKDLTFAIFKQVLMEPEFRDWPDVGIVVQAYLPCAESDLHSLAKWTRDRGTPITIRLVKGAYWDYEVLLARQHGWTVPVFQQKWASDASFERCTTFLFENHPWLRPAFASHNIRSLSHAMATAESRNIPPAAYEIQVLHGMGGPIQKAVAARGNRVRVYTPYGAMLPGMAYLVRRLLENTSNESFLKAGFTEKARVDDLLIDPREVGEMWKKSAKNRPVTSSLDELPPFRNEPLTDFSREPSRVAMKEALRDVRTRFGRVYLGEINGTSRVGQEELLSLNPGDTSTVIARFPKCDSSNAEAAVATARSAFGMWSQTPATERAGVLVRAAAIMRNRRFELSAWEVYECGKLWREADADVAEAIDFCEFYARAMIRLAEPRRRDVSGETNASEPLARGVAVVIPPWNFPLAIPCGMTVAALVAGNTVVLKPSERSPLMSYHLTKILAEAGLPEGVLTLLTGYGDVGRALVDHPQVDLIAFTGSREVGLEINRRAADTRPGQDHVKRVIAEMGGKNAIIVDDDADLDEAVIGVLQSAFGYSGQKCSACSRAIVLTGVYDAFVSRLAEAMNALPIGPADDPNTAIGPVIDLKARDRIWEYGRIARAEGRVVAHGDVGTLIDRGAYVAPLIVADVAPTARIAQEEVFGPILAVIHAKDLSDALTIANGTDYALTGGLYSRSPANIARVKREFRVGNLYINRTSTGALVDRQPFGGFKLSGIGTKAGGSDYLHEFLLSRCVTENTMRRGFAPDVLTSEVGAGAVFDGPNRPGVAPGGEVPAERG